MTAFNPNHPDVKKRVEKYISSALELPVEFILALPVKESGRTLPWKVEVASGDKRLFILLKTPKPEKEDLSDTADKYDFFRQYRLLKQLETTKLKTPKVWGLDEKGSAFGIPCFLEESLKGRVLYNFLKMKEEWAENLFIKAIIEVQKIKREDLGELSGELGEDTGIKDFFFRVKQDIRQFSKGPLISRTLEELTDNLPVQIPPCFGNGNFNPKNFIVKDKNLTGIIDFESAGFFDPLYEFLLPFERYPLLKNRGLEEAYCKQMGFEAGIINWYRGIILTAKLLQALKDEKSNKTQEDEGRNVKEEILEELSKWVKI
ncbi:MAG: phosphotransferase [Candidatus Firestonebacteria bacterium]